MKSQYKYSLLFMVLIIFILNLYILSTSIASINRTYDSEFEKILAIQNYIEQYTGLPDSSILNKTKRIFDLNNIFITGYTHSLNANNRYFAVFDKARKRNRIIKNTILKIDKQHYMFVIPEVSKHYYIIGVYNNPLFQIIDSQRSLLFITIISSFGIIVIFIIISILAFKPMIYMELLAKNVRTPVKDEIYHDYVPKVFKETIETLKEKNRELEHYYNAEKERSKNIETYLTSSLNMINTPIYLFKDGKCLYKNDLAKELSISYDGIENIISSWDKDEISLGNTTYSIMRNTIKRKSTNLGILFMLFDVTKNKARSIIEKNINTINLLGNVSVNLAHEFKNSLGVISGYIQILKKKTNIKELDILESETTYMLNSINKFIGINKIKNITKSSVSIGEFKSEIKQIAKNIDMDLEFSAETEITLLIDKQLILQAIKNAFINSKEAGATKIIVEINKSGPSIVLMIKDNGKGFSENALENLFVPFFTEKEHGSGIGMVYMNRIITLHNAFLHAGNYSDGAFIKIVFTEVNNEHSDS